MPTRQFSIHGQTDIALCEPHVQAVRAQGIAIGVPVAAAAYMFGLKPWPTGAEPCHLCAGHPLPVTTPSR